MTREHQAGLGPLLRPRSIAIVGASQDPDSLSGRPLEVLRQHAYAGRIYIVNPNRGQVGGLVAYPSVAALPEPVDLAVVAVRAAHVPGIVADCAAVGVRAAVIFSAGFAETDAAGRAAQDRLAATARASGMRLLGPNGEGFFNAADRVAVTFSPALDRRRGLKNLVAGNLGIVSQSGGLGFALFNWGQAVGLGASFVVTTGNESDVEALEVADVLLADGQTAVVALIVEGLRRPADLARVAQRARDSGKRLVVAKLGGSVAGRRAAPVHTAHESGDEAEYDRMFRAGGIVRAEDQEDLLDVCFALCRGRPMRGRRVGVVTTSGGAGIWVADACEAHGLSVPGLSAPAQAALRPLLPGFGSAANPVDVTAQMVTGGSIATVLWALGASGEVDAVVAVASLAGPDLLRREGRALRAVLAELTIPVVICSYTVPGEPSRELLRELAVPWYPSPRRAARALRALARPGEDSRPKL
jgi:acyl-CoA synthetase (NDP forming)